jgi:ubiquinone/menaquinone biosynthesis C-methylase UbiE
MSQRYSKKSGKEFNRISQDYDRGRRSENVEFWAKEISSLTGINQNSLVLDLGSGTGLYSTGIYNESKATFCGMDPVSGMLEQAKYKSDEIHWFNAIGESLPIRDAVFDCIFSSQVWHHIENKQATADECRRVLRQVGYTVIRTISHDQLNKKIVFDYFPEIKDNQLNLYPSNEDFARYFENAGFSEIRFFEYSLERYQSVEELVDIAKNKLWSMFRPITDEGLERGVEKLWKYYHDTGGSEIRNDELITLIVSYK